MDMVARLVDEKPLVIFSKSSCCMSHSIKTLLYDFGANPTVYELDQMPNGQQIERALLQLGCRPSVPAVFIGQQFIGGTNTVMSLHMQNKLVPLLMRAKAIWIWNNK
ncbi:monothiol glutaredoxin-S6-like [Rosa sericea]|uniref:monothiol glutaredoxin-S6-like n=1 Tax=Rosa rugosa TaxID=74645 RepID=UPI002B407D00|nr:monothiol glutaredoxin-S6-like [Rosa rugosa]